MTNKKLNTGFVAFMVSLLLSSMPSHAVSHKKGTITFKPINFNIYNTAFKYRNNDSKISNNAILGQVFNIEQDAFKGTVFHDEVGNKLWVL